MAGAQRVAADIVPLMLRMRRASPPFTTLRMRSMITFGRAFVIGVVLFICAGAAASGQDNCIPVVFSPGANGTEVTGTAPPNDVLCYALRTNAGQTASIAVTQGNNIIFSIADLIDAQDRYSFRTEAKTYRILVGQLMRSATNEPFRIRVSVTGGRRSPANSAPKSNKAPPASQDLQLPI